MHTAVIAMFAGLIGLSLGLSLAARASQLRPPPPGTLAFFLFAAGCFTILMVMAALV